MVAVYLDTRNRLIGWTIAHIGTINRAAVEPRTNRPLGHPAGPGLGAAAARALELTSCYGNTRTSNRVEPYSWNHNVPDVDLCRSCSATST